MQFYFLFCVNVQLLVLSSIFKKIFAPSENQLSYYNQGINAGKDQSHYIPNQFKNLFISVLFVFQVFLCEFCFSFIPKYCSLYGQVFFYSIFFTTNFSNCLQTFEKQIFYKLSIYYYFYISKTILGSRALIFKNSKKRNTWENVLIIQMNINLILQKLVFQTSQQANTMKIVLFIQIDYEYFQMLPSLRQDKQYKMNIIRQKVGGHKNRYKEEGYNLDLTYITPRLIAMAFPGSGLEKLYRNSVDDVQEFLTKHHHHKYMIVNLSGREVDEKKLLNVLNIQWQDHQSPLFEKLFIICKKMSMYLHSDPEKVVAVHCNHGKGRTGTIICCFLLYCNMFKNATLAMDYYAKKRFETNGSDIEGFGVTQPCQIQYIHYFQEVLRNPKILPRVLTIRKVKFSGDHKYEKLYFKLKSFEGNRTIISTKNGQTNNLVEKSEEKEICYKIYEEKYFAGDAKLEIKTSSTLSNYVVASYSFNTAFVDNNLRIKLEELSPYSLRKGDSFGNGFFVEISFKPICECPREIDFGLRCERCRQPLLHEENRWKEIRNSFREYQKLNQYEKQIILGFPKKTQLMVEDKQKGQQ